MHRLALIPALLLLAACGDETLSNYASGTAYTLTEIDGRAFPARASVAFDGPGRIVGQAPCNSFTADITVPYPWFELGRVQRGTTACGFSAQEDQFFEALRRMTLAESYRDTLVLSNEAGGEMVFRVQSGI